MKCDRQNNLDHGWNRYCTGLDILAKIPLIKKAFKDDTFFGLYLGCPCKMHDIRYSIEGWSSKKLADSQFKLDIQKQGIIQNKRITAFFAKHIMWFFVFAFGNLPGKLKCWKSWSSEWAERYQ